MDLYLSKLEHFTGSTEYYNVMGVLVTDGIKYIMENGYSWFVTDAIVVIKHNKKIQRYLSKDDFLVVRLKLKDSEAILEIDNGNGLLLYRRVYWYTDAKRELKLYYSNNVLCLAGEY